IREDQRGPVDVKARSNGGWFRAGARLDLGNGTLVTASGGYSATRTINGIDIEVTQTQTAYGNLSAVHHVSDDQVSWEGHVYVRDQKFSSFFAAVNDDHTAAAPANDQFNVPSSSVGANGIVRVPLADDVTVEVGADLRYVEGETNERFFVINNKFSRQRTAGGEQLVAGAFAEVNWQANPSLILTAGVLVDYWRQSDGTRREVIIASGNVLRDDTFSSRDGTVANFRLGARNQFTDTFALKAVAYSGFRVPTVNELYRPFRVGNDITEANPNLDPERMWGVEGGFEWMPVRNFSLEATYFHVWLNDAVSNVTVTTTPGFNAELGAFVPPGGSLRQRRNLDRIEADGVEMAASWRVADQLDVTLRYLFTDPRVARSADEPVLVGNRLAQVAHHQGALAITWRPRDGWTVRAEGRAV
ncbi:MAG: TonB-dependent receptor, partial [Rhodospirillaceae bacterium]